MLVCKKKMKMQHLFDANFGKTERSCVRIISGGCCALNKDVVDSVLIII